MTPIIVLVLWVIHFGLRLCLEKPLFYTGCLLAFYTGFAVLDLLKQEKYRRNRRANTLKILDEF